MGTLKKTRSKVVGHKGHFLGDGCSAPHGKKMKGSTIEVGAKLQAEAQAKVGATFKVGIEAHWITPSDPSPPPPEQKKEEQKAVLPPSLEGTLLVAVDPQPDLPEAYTIENLVAWHSGDGSWPDAKCVACHLAGDHPVMMLCGCGHAWGTHSQHDCSACGTYECFPRLLWTGLWVSVKGNNYAVGCKCSICLPLTEVRGGGAKQIKPSPASAVRRNLKAAKWGLDPKLILAEGAADFYLLMEMSVSGHSVVDETFAKHAQYMAEQLACYLEMACLGEFRYIHNEKISLAQLDDTIIPWKTRLRGLIKQTTASGPKTKKGEAKVEDDPRLAYWAAWRHLSEQYGLELHEILGDAFRKLRWGTEDGVKDNDSCSVGGNKWAVCIETALAYRKGLSNVVFVDQALGLKHNATIAYSKFWDTKGLQQVLDAALTGEVAVLLPYGSTDIRKLWKEWKGETTEEEALGSRHHKG